MISLLAPPVMHKMARSLIKNNQIFLKLTSNYSSQNGRIFATCLDRTTFQSIQHASCLPVLQTRKMASSNDEVLFEEIDSKGIITLNRPKVLNALTENMVKVMYNAMKDWEKCKRLVIIKGAGEKAFCAGGDIVHLTTEDCRHKPETREFFRHEYILNNYIGIYKIPFIALINGIVMGGGCGVSINGQFRVATEKSLLAMPETSIGLFPDVGGSHFLSRLGGGLGMFLALTGYRLRGNDLVQTGLATHFCPHEKLEELEGALLSLPSNLKPEHVKGVLDSFHKSPESFSLAHNLKDIKNCFTAPNLKELMIRLEKSPNEFCRQQLSVMNTMSPTSLLITFEQLSRGVNLNLQECLKMEFRMTKGIFHDHDFFEGVRSKLVDKDNNPKWKPSSLEEIDLDKLILKYFSMLPPEEELVLPTS